MSCSLEETQKEEAGAEKLADADREPPEKRGRGRPHKSLMP